MKLLILATRNPGKLREIRQVLSDLPLTVQGLEDFPSLPEPDETGSTFADNARLKALYYADATGQWCLADDSGLVVDALGGKPGVHSARYAADRCPPGSPRAVLDAANNRQLLEELAAVPDERRTARFVCHLAMARPGRVLIETDGVIEGRLIHEPRGQNGFGYDPLFFYPPLGGTTAQLPEDQKNEVSHRGQALRRFAAMLGEFLQRGTP